MIGDGWQGAVVAHALKGRGMDPILYLAAPSTYPMTDPVVLYVGNGETREKAELIFGESVARDLWEISEANWTRALDLLRICDVPHETKGLVRFPQQTIERGASFSGDALEHALLEDLSIAGRFRRLKGLSCDPDLVAHVRLDTFEVSAPFVILVSEHFESSAVAALAGIRIPITLSSFTYRIQPPFSGSVAVFNDGADFAVGGGDTWRLGSFRNLFQDRGVGLHDKPDEIASQNLAAYFTKLNWIPSGARGDAGMSYESISCDGLPIVGTFSALPSVVFVTGFAARSACFLFELAERLATQVTTGEASRLGVFSPRRML